MQPPTKGSIDEARGCGGGRLLETYTRFNDALLNRKTCIEQRLRGRWGGRAGGSEVERGGKKFDELHRRFDPFDASLLNWQTPCTALYCIE